MKETEEHTSNDDNELPLQENKNNESKKSNRILIFKTFIVICVLSICSTYLSIQRNDNNNNNNNTSTKSTIEQDIDEKTPSRNLQSSENELSSNTEAPYLNSESIILITGGAGFLGTNLALSLYHTYSPKKVLLVDTLDVHPAWAEMRSSSASAKSPNDYSSKILHAISSSSSSMSEEDIARMEYKRQRLFWTLQILKDKAVFFKSDIRPSIPEFWDVGEIPLLDMIFKQYNVTHVVHLADSFAENARDVQAIPRVKDQTKSGLIEAVLEQLRKVKEQGHTPHFTYASTSEVYDRVEYNPEETLPPSSKEINTINAPSSLRGAGKLIDEILTGSYFDSYGINSVGLRFFQVYGPWGAPTSIPYQMAERAVTDGHNNMLPKSIRHKDAALDYVYIDDAIDAIMSAMQYKPPHPVVFNIGTGIATSFQKMADMMTYYFPRKAQEFQDTSSNTAHRTVSYADTNLAKIHLGFTARTSLNDGIIQLLAWHYDRISPYNTPPYPKHYHNAFIASHGMQQCNPLDQECLKGATIFPCASECARDSNCLPSMYDAVLTQVREVTKECENVLFTILLDENVSSIPAAKYATSDTNSNSPFFDQPCNIAFVPKSSPLVSNTPSLKHGPFHLIPLPYTQSPTPDLPKFSPGKFFPTAKYAIYIEPNILLTSLPALLDMLHQSNVPQQDNNLLPSTGSISLLTSFQTIPLPSSTNADRLQERTYTMFRIGLRGELRMTTKRIDTSWIIYSLQEQHDATSYRCDVLSEVLQWNATDSSRSLYFVSSLHDLWSKSFSKQSDNHPGAVSRNLQQDEEEEEDEDEDSSEEDMEVKKEGEWFTMLSANNQWIRILDNSMDYMIRLDDFQ